MDEERRDKEACDLSEGTESVPSERSEWTSQEEVIAEGEGWGDGIFCEAEEVDQESGRMAEAEEVPLPKLPLQSCPPKRRRLTKKEDHPRVVLTGAQRLLLLDTWRRSQLPAGDFAPLVGLTKHSLYAWKRRFQDEGPAGLAAR